MKREMGVSMENSASDSKFKQAFIPGSMNAKHEKATYCASG